MGVEVWVLEVKQNNLKSYQIMQQLAKKIDHAVMLAMLLCQSNALLQVHHQPATQDTDKWTTHWLRIPMNLIVPVMQIWKTIQNNKIQIEAPMRVTGKDSKRNDGYIY